MNAAGIEHVMRAELARGDTMAGTMLPILRHIISNDDKSIFSDEIIARIRGMMRDLADQLLGALAHSARTDENGAFEERTKSVFHALIDNPLLLGHIHSIAMEAQLAERLQARLDIHPVAPPIVQTLIESHDPATQALAMQVLASQARFGQAQRRMRLSLMELPGDEFHAALIAFRSAIGHDQNAGDALAAAEQDLRKQYDEGQVRIALLARLVHSLGDGATAALCMMQAGVAVFVTALATVGCQTRDSAILATHETQRTRLALVLRSAGLSPEAIAAELVALHPDMTLPTAFASLREEEANAILADGWGKG